MTPFQNHRRRSEYVPASRIEAIADAEWQRGRSRQQAVRDRIASMSGSDLERRIIDAIEAGDLATELVLTGEADRRANGARQVWGIGGAA